MKKAGHFVACFSVILLGISVTVRAQTPAFPGAQGFGQFATGGRGGTVYHVTNTNDSGPGSFRDAVSVSGRTVVFDVGGVINYQAPRYAPKPNITIAGQTAPGGGITIYGNGLSFSGANNDICRFVRVREGINGDSGTDAMGIANGHDMIFDHITSSWGRDETFSINGSITNISIQSAIISQGLQGHSAGGLIQADGGVSILRCLYIDNDTRNPKVKFVNEFVNNVICNWETIGYNMGGDSAGDSYANNFNNYFISGQASGSTAIGGGNLNFHIYATNNWVDSNKNGVLDGSAWPFANYGSMDLQATPFAYPITNAYTPLTALKLAISDAGPSFKRDSVDELMISQLTSWGLLGGTITSELVAPMNGPGVVRNGTPYPDTDQDGMPDYWENGTGSNPNVANNNDPSPFNPGYTRLEDYLNWLVEPHGVALMNTNVVIDLRQFTRGWVAVNHGPAWSAGNPTNGTLSFINSYFVQFTPNAGLNGTASFQFTVNDSDGEPFTRTMNLFFTPSAQPYQPVWHGDDLTNNWNVLGDYNWHDGISLLYQFHNGDAVTFDDSGSTSPAVNLIGSLQPASITVAATKNFTFGGSGSLDGTMALNKTNTGTLTIANANSFTGPTTVSTGTLLVNGALQQSAVTVKAGGAAGGSGILGNGLTAQSGASILPGNGIGAAGTLTITNTLSESGGVTNRFDFSDDPTGTIKTNDLIQAVGNLNLSGTNLIKVSLLDSLPGNGVYTLFTYTGALTGGLSNLIVSGVIGTLTNPPNAIAIIVSATRPPATLVWTGNGGNNFWDNGTNVAWLDDGVPDRFFFLDDVIFDDTGATNLTANLAGDLTPNSVTVAATVNYTFAGTGKITGTTGLTKTNSGTLAILTANDFTGPVAIDGGGLSVASLANSGVASAIGAATSDPANLVLDGGTLSYTAGSVSSDRGATFNGGGATLDVPNGGTTLTWNGTNVGSGALTKTGPGTLTLSAANTFSGGTIVSNGTLALFGPAGGATTTANNYSLGSGSVTLDGGTLKLFGGGLGDAAAGYGTFSNPLIVPAGATATVLTPARYTMSSTLTGSGTLNLEVNYVRGSLSGNWSGFTGLINVTAHTAPAEFRVVSSAGYAGAAIFLNDNVILDRNGAAITVEIGSLSGTSGAIVGPGNSSSGGSSYRVGWNNADATFAGQLQADGVNSFTKVGTGNWTLTGANSYTGGTVVNAGTLTVNNTGGSGTGSGAVTVNSGASLAGNGTIGGALTIGSGATLTPGAASIGTLTVNNNATLSAGSTTVIEINKTTLARDQLNALNTLTYGGTLVVTNLGGTLTNGDSFKIFNAGSYAGSFATSNLPPLAPDLLWNTATLNTSGTLGVVSTNFTGPQPLTWTGDGVSNLWDTGTSLNWLTTNSVPRAFLNGDSVTFNDSGANSPAINLITAVLPGSMTVNASQNYTLSGPGALTGIMTLVKSGSGTLTLLNTGTNSFTGGTTISSGTLQIGDGASINGSLSGGIVNNSTLIFANPTTVTNSSAISGGGTLRKNGPGALVLTGSQTYTGQTTVNAGSLQINGAIPSSDLVNNGNVTWAPAGSQIYSNTISGSGSLTASSSGLLTLSNANTYTGGTTNNAGGLMLVNNSAAGSGPVVYNGGIVFVGNGAVITNDFTVPSATTDLMMAGTNNNTGTWAGNIVNFGSGAQWRPGSDGGTLIFTGNALLGGRNFIMPRGTFVIASNAVISAGGSACALGRDGSNGNRSAVVTVRDNAIVSLGFCSLGGSNQGGNITITLQNNAALTVNTNLDLHNVNRSTATTTVNLNGGTLTVGGFFKTRTGATQFATNNFNGGTLKANTNNNSFLPALTGLTANVRAGGAIIDDGGFVIAVAAPLIHDPALGATADGGLTKLGAGSVVLFGAETFTGPTTILGGQLSLFPPGSIGSSTGIYIAPAATLNVNQIGGMTLGSGRTLSGGGAVIGSFTIGSGATLAPGSNSIGTLTFNNNLTLASGSTNIFEISHLPLTNDLAIISGALTNGGTLIITNSGGSALTAGDSFKLFNAGSYSGAFANVVLPPLNSGLAWNTNALNTSGVITVVSTPPLFGNLTVTGGNVTLNGSGGMATSNFYVLSATNLALPWSNWTRLLTNQFDNNGNFNVTNALDPDSLQSFYRLQLP